MCTGGVTCVVLLCPVVLAHYHPYLVCVGFGTVISTSPYGFGNRFFICWCAFLLYHCIQIGDVVLASFFQMLANKPAALLCIKGREKGELNTITSKVRLWGEEAKLQSLIAACSFAF